MEKPNSIWRNENGATATFLAAALFVLLAVAALAIDTGHIYGMRAKLQHAADAAALAGVSLLPNETAARAEAIDYATKNMPTETYGSVLATTDIAFGNWNGTTRVFTLNGTPRDAVRVHARRAAANSNSLPIFFSSVLGLSSMDMVVESIAWGVAGTDCEISGVIAGRQVLSGSANNYLDAPCVYGRDGVHMGSTNFFSPGSQVGMEDLSDLQAGSNNTGLSDALWEGDMQPGAAQQVDQLISDLRNGIGMPEYITNTVTVSSLPSTLVQGRAYIVNGPASVPSNTNFSNIVVVATGEVSIASNFTMSNVVLASSMRVQMGSNGTVGNANYCSTGAGGTVQLLGHENVQLGSNINYYGVQAIAGADVDMGSNNLLYPLAAQAARDMKDGSDIDLRGCTAQTAHVRYGVGPKLRLVN